MRRSFLFSFVLAFSLTVSAESLTFKRDGKKTLSLGLSSMKKGLIKVKKESFKSKIINLYDSVRKREVTYLAYPFYELLDQAFSPSWRKAHKLYFVAEDGYRVSTKISKMLVEDGQKKAYLAYGEKGEDGFTPYEKGSRKFSLAPFYLVWSGHRPEDKRKFMKYLKWPYQLKEVRLREAPVK